MRGCIYLQNINNCTIKSNTFQYNDVGPILDKIQVIGFVRNLDKDYGHVPRASALYIDDGCKNIKVQQNTFQDNRLHFLHNVISKYNFDMVNFFPPSYFHKSFSTLINIR